LYLSRFNALLLGQPKHQRVRVLTTLLTLAIYCLFALLQQVAVWLGFIDQNASLWLTAFYLLGSTGFYLLLRSGLSARLSPEPALQLWQNIHGLLATVWAYAITGPLRGAILAILVLIVARGMFALGARQARWLGVFAVTLLAGLMLWKTRSDPQHFPPPVEAVHLVIGVIVLLGVSVLSSRMGAFRIQLRDQKQALEISLARTRLLATQDELTGLANRHHMLALLKAEQARQQRTDQPLSLVVLDLDHFKRVNDAYGHLAGDVVLKGFAEAARSTLRGSDVLSRWGGEEFLLMLPDTGLDEAERCVDRMREGLAQVIFTSVAPDLQITFSAGLSVCRVGEDLDAVIERADQAMYRAKAQGRNCTVSA
jgi:diguanylate cyclase (GGDEF)-like protein